jgi:hypothetical protein
LLYNLVRIGSHGEFPEMSRQVALPDYHPGCNGFQLTTLGGCYPDGLPQILVTPNHFGAFAL